jgi:hypothetical protein
MGNFTKRSNRTEQSDDRIPFLNVSIVKKDGSRVKLPKGLPLNEKYAAHRMILEAATKVADKEFTLVGTIYFPSDDVEEDEVNPDDF